MDGQTNGQATGQTGRRTIQLLDALGSLSSWRHKNKLGKSEPIVLLATYNPVAPWEESGKYYDPIQSTSRCTHKAQGRLNIQSRWKTIQ